MFRRIGSILGFIFAVAAYYELRKLHTWGPVQEAVSYLPRWIIAVGPIIGLAAWVLLVLPERVARQLGQMVGLRSGIPETWLAWVTWLAAPLVVYFMIHMASDATGAVYGGIFILCLFALMAKEVSKGHPKGRRH